MKHQGTWGDGAYILKTGQMLEPQVQSSNEIRIRDGALMVQGALGCVKVNTYDPVTIQNGTQGMKRIDLICWQYTYDAEQDVESAEWVVIQGTPAESDPQQPAYTDGDIQQGDSPVQVPVFAVELDGINVTGVTTLLPTAPTLEELNSKLPVVLYDNDDTPAKGAITLSDSAANYSRLTILYKNNDEFYGSTDVYNPDGKKVALLNFSFGDITTEDPVYLKFRTILISGNTINTAQDKSGAYLTGEQRLSDGRHFVKNDFISITTVLGYR